jgi:hypothetical protein
LPDQEGKITLNKGHLAVAIFLSYVAISVVLGFTTPQGIGAFIMFAICFGVAVVSFMSVMLYQLFECM